MWRVKIATTSGTLYFKNTIVQVQHVSVYNILHVVYTDCFKDEETGQNKHELLQYSVRTINNSKVSRITYQHKMHALYEKRV